MAGLTTAGYISLALTAAAGGLEAYSSYNGGKATERAYEAQAAQDEANARAKALETSINEDTLRREKRQELARMLAAQGEAGLEGGTATGAYMSSFRNAEQDAMNLRYQGMSQWANYKNQAALNRFYGKQAFKQGQMGRWVALGKTAASMATMGMMSGLGAVTTAAQTTGNSLAAGGSSTSLGGYSYLGKNPYMFYGA